MLKLIKVLVEIRSMHKLLPICFSFSIFFIAIAIEITHKHDQVSITSFCCFLCNIESSLSKLFISGFKSGNKIIQAISIVARLCMSVEQMKNSWISHYNFGIQYSLMGESVTKHPNSVGEELARGNGESGQNDKSTISKAVGQERGSLGAAMIHQTSFQCIWDQPLLSGIEGWKDFLVAYNIKLV